MTLIGNFHTVHSVHSVHFDPALWPWTMGMDIIYLFRIFALPPFLPDSGHPIMQDFDINITPTDWGQESSLIKVVGVGGGGCNAVNYMYGQGIKGCSFIVCNTNARELEKYQVPMKIQLGETGLGAGTDPVKGRTSALESQDEITSLILDSGTKMLFITAGMGGGTGTGAAPVIASLAKERGILTVAVVTIPFQNEGADKFKKALAGIHELERCTDALLIINNQKLYQFFGDTLTYEAFPKADEVLATAVRGIIEIISLTGYIDVDFQDVSNMLKNSGMALMGSGEGTGPNRLEDAVKATFESPLLSDYDLSTAKNVLINITSGKNKQGLMMSELEKLDDMIASYTGKASRFKKGIVWDENPEFGDKVRITAIVTGFKFDLGGIDTEDLDNLVIIDGNYDWDSNFSNSSEQPVESPQPLRVGPTRQTRHDFTTETKPVLCVRHGDNMAELEHVSAYRRKG